MVEEKLLYATKATTAGILGLISYQIWHIPLGFIAIFTPVIMISSSIGAAREKALLLLMGLTIGILAGLSITPIKNLWPNLAPIAVLSFLFVCGYIMKIKSLLMPASIAGVMSILIVDAHGETLWQLAWYMPLSFLLGIFFYLVCDRLVYPIFASQTLIAKEKEFLQEAERIFVSLSKDGIDNTDIRIVQDCLDALTRLYNRYVDLCKVVRFERKKSTRLHYINGKNCMLTVLEFSDFLCNLHIDSNLLDQRIGQLEKQILNSIVTFISSMPRTSDQGFNQQPVLAMQNVRVREVIPHLIDYSRHMIASFPNQKEQAFEFNAVETSYGTQLFPVDYKQLIYASKTVFAVGLTYLMQIFFDWPFHVVATATAFLVTAPYSGKTMQTIYWRVSGAIIGVLIGLLYLVILNFYQSLLLLYGLMFLTLLACARFGAISEKYNYISIQIIVVITIMVVSTHDYDAGITAGLWVRGLGIIAGSLTGLIATVIFPNFTSSEISARLRQSTELLQSALSDRDNVRPVIIQLRIQCDRLQELQQLLSYETMFVKKSHQAAMKQAIKDLRIIVRKLSYIDILNRIRFRA